MGRASGGKRKPVGRSSAAGLVSRSACDDGAPYKRQAKSGTVKHLSHCMGAASRICAALFLLNAAHQVWVWCGQLPHTPWSSQPTLPRLQLARPTVGAAAGVQFASNADITAAAAAASASTLVSRASRRRDAPLPAAGLSAQQQAHTGATAGSNSCDRSSSGSCPGRYSHGTVRREQQQQQYRFLHTRSAMVAERLRVKVSFVELVIKLLRTPKAGQQQPTNSAGATQAPPHRNAAYEELRRQLQLLRLDLLLGWQQQRQQQQEAPTTTGAAQQAAAKGCGCGKNTAAAASSTGTATNNDKKGCCGGDGDSGSGSISSEELHERLVEVEDLVDAWTWFSLGYNFWQYNTLKEQLYDEEGYTYFMTNRAREQLLLNKCFEGQLMSGGQGDPRVPLWEPCSYEQDQGDPHSTACSAVPRPVVQDRTRAVEAALQRSAALGSCGFMCVVYRHTSADLRYPHHPGAPGFNELVKELAAGGHCGYGNNYCRGMLSEEVVDAVIDAMYSSRLPPQQPHSGGGGGVPGRGLDDGGYYQQHYRQFQYLYGDPDDVDLPHPSLMQVLAQLLGQAYHMASVAGFWCLVWMAVRSVRDACCRLAERSSLIGQLQQPWAQGAGGGGPNDGGSSSAKHRMQQQQQQQPRSTHAASLQTAPVGSGLVPGSSFIPLLLLLIPGGSWAGLSGFAADLSEPHRQQQQPSTAAGTRDGSPVVQPTDPDRQKPLTQKSNWHEEGTRRRKGSTVPGVVLADRQVHDDAEAAAGTTGGLNKDADNSDCSGSSDCGSSDSDRSDSKQTLSSATNLPGQEPPRPMLGSAEAAVACGGSIGSQGGGQHSGATSPSAPSSPVQHSGSTSPFAPSFPAQHSGANSPSAPSSPPLRGTSPVCRSGSLPPPSLLATPPRLPTSLPRVLATTTPAATERRSETLNPGAALPPRMWPRYGQQQQQQPVKKCVPREASGGSGGWGSTGRRLPMPPAPPPCCPPPASYSSSLPSLSSRALHRLLFQEPACMQQQQQPPLQQQQHPVQPQQQPRPTSQRQQPPSAVRATPSAAQLPASRPTPPPAPPARPSPSYLAPPRPHVARVLLPLGSPESPEAGMAAEAMAVAAAPQRHRPQGEPAPAAGQGAPRTVGRTGRSAAAASPPPPAPPFPSPVKQGSPASARPKQPPPPAVPLSPANAQPKQPQLPPAVALLPASAQPKQPELLPHPPPAAGLCFPASVQPKQTLSPPALPLLSANVYPKQLEQQQQQPVRGTSPLLPLPQQPQHGLQKAQPVTPTTPQPKAVQPRNKQRPLQAPYRPQLQPQPQPQSQPPYKPQLQPTQLPQPIYKPCLPLPQSVQQAAAHPRSKEQVPPPPPPPAAPTPPLEHLQQQQQHGAKDDAGDALSTALPIKHLSKEQQQHVPGDDASDAWQPLLTQVLVALPTPPSPGSLQGSNASPGSGQGPDASPISGLPTPPSPGSLQGSNASPGSGQGPPAADRLAKLQQQQQQDEDQQQQQQQDEDHQQQHHHHHGPAADQLAKLLLEGLQQRHAFPVAATTTASVDSDVWQSTGLATDQARDSPARQQQQQDEEQQQNEEQQHDAPAADQLAKLLLEGLQQPHAFSGATAPGAAAPADSDVWRSTGLATDQAPDSPARQQQQQQHDEEQQHDAPAADQLAKQLLEGLQQPHAFLGATAPGAPAAADTDVWRSTGLATDQAPDSPARQQQQQGVPDDHHIVAAAAAGAASLESPSSPSTISSSLSEAQQLLLLPPNVSCSGSGDHAVALGDTQDGHHQQQQQQQAADASAHADELVHSMLASVLLDLDGSPCSGE